MEKGRAAICLQLGKPLKGGDSALSWVMSASPSGAASEKALSARDWKEKGNFSWLRGLRFLGFGDESVFSPPCERQRCRGLRPAAAGAPSTHVLFILLPVQSPLKFARKRHRPHQRNSGRWKASPGAQWQWVCRARRHENSVRWFPRPCHYASAANSLRGHALSLALVCTSTCTGSHTDSHETHMHILTDSYDTSMHTHVHTHTETHTRHTHSLSYTIADILQQTGTLLLTRSRTHTLTGVVLGLRETM